MSLRRRKRKLERERKGRRLGKRGERISRASAIPAFSRQNIMMMHGNLKGQSRGGRKRRRSEQAILRDSSLGESIILMSQMSRAVPEPGSTVDDIGLGRKGPHVGPLWVTVLVKAWSS